MTEKVAVWEVSANGDGQSFPVGNPLHNQAVQVKSFLGVFSPFRVTLAHCSSEQEVCFTQACVDHGPHLLGKPSAALETSVRYEHKQRFSGYKGALNFQNSLSVLKVLLSVKMQQGIIKKELFPSFLERQSQKRSTI